MSKFNQRVAPAPLRQPDAVTHQGGQGFTRSIKDDLFVLGLANFVGEDTFYEKGKDRDAAFAALVKANALNDPEWTRAFIGWLRSEGNMRSAPIVAAAEYASLKSVPGGRQVIASVLQRPDEPGELLAYWMAKYSRTIPSKVKRGIADALPRLYNERNVLKFDGQGHEVRFGDVVEIVHPKPQTPLQGDLYRHVIDRRHGREDVPESLATIRKDRHLMGIPPEGRRGVLHQAVEAGWSWERIAGWVPGGMDAKAWEAAIPNMGLMALTRNLRNFDNLTPGLSPMAVADIQRRFLDIEEVRRSRQFPLRYLTAWKNVQSMRWGPSLETALNLSLANVPSLPGRTLVLIDVSGSMKDLATTKRTDGRASTAAPVLRWEVATIFGLAIGQRAEKADCFLFDSEVRAQVDMAPAESILRQAQACSAYVGGGTDTFGAVAQTFADHDRVIIITDEQTGPAYRGGYYAHHSTPFSAIEHIKAPVYTWNLAGYSVGHTPIQKNWHLFGGLTDSAFKLVPILEQRQAGLWPWDIKSNEDR